MLWDDWARKCFEIHHVRNFCLAVIHRPHFSMHARSLINIPSSFRIPLIVLTLLFITRAHNNIVSIVSIKPEAIYFYLNAALHTFTLAAHITYAGYRQSLVRPAGPGPRASTGRLRPDLRDLFSILSFCKALYSGGYRGQDPRPGQYWHRPLTAPLAGAGLWAGHNGYSGSASSRVVR